MNFDKQLNNILIITFKTKNSCKQSVYSEKYKVYLIKCQNLEENKLISFFIDQNFFPKMFLPMFLPRIFTK